MIVPGCLRSRGRRRASARIAAVAFVAAAAASLVGGSRPAGAAPSQCSDSNRPNTLTVVGGSPQTAQLGKPFQTNLQVALANTNGCPLTGQLGGYAVSFSAPSGGASGIFANSGSNTVTVGTDATGTATAPTFTANDTAGSYSVHADSDFGSTNLYLTNTAGGLAASIAPAGATAQEASVNSQYGQPLQARVLDANGRPVQGVATSFALGSGPSGAGASFLTGGAQATATTKSDGVATSPLFVANSSPGRFTATASASDLSSVATFSLDNHAAAQTLRAVGALAQTATVDHRYRRPLSAQLLDPSGQPVEGASVTFTLGRAAAGATASFPDGSSQATEISDSSGRASSPPLAANSTAGSFTATASVNGSTPLSFRLRNLAGAAATITVGAADGQSAPTGSRFPIRLAVTITDRDGNPVPGVLVTFSAPTHGPSGRFDRYARGRTRRNARKSSVAVHTARVVRVKTDRKSIAIAPPFTANGHSGGYAVTVRVGGQRAAFALVNTRR
jgi:protocatechuate 3,4-dioxygenase beta subunit